MKEAPVILVCPPDFYGVEYVINPWMEGNIRRASQELAARQWHGFVEALGKIARLEMMLPVAGLPDMVFTANAGIVLGEEFVLSRFFYRERQVEEPVFRDWFLSHGYHLHELPPDLPFEGAGDALWDAAREVLWAAYGMRTELEAHRQLAEL